MDDRELLAAIDKGSHAERVGKSMADNPYMPLSEEALYAAWIVGFEIAEGTRYVIATGSVN